MLDEAARAEFEVMHAYAQHFGISFAAVEHWVCTTPVPDPVGVLRRAVEEGVAVPGLGVSDG